MSFQSSSSCPPCYTAWPTSSIKYVHEWKSLYVCPKAWWGLAPFYECRTEVWRKEVTCPRSHNQDLGFWLLNDIFQALKPHMNEVQREMNSNIWGQNTTSHSSPERWGCPHSTAGVRRHKINNSPKHEFCRQSWGSLGNFKTKSKTLTPREVLKEVGHLHFVV